MTGNRDKKMNEYELWVLKKSDSTKGNRHIKKVKLVVKRSDTFYHVGCLWTELASHCSSKGGKPLGRQEGKKSHRSAEV